VCPRCRALDAGAIACALDAWPSMRVLSLVRRCSCPRCVCARSCARCLCPRCVRARSCARCLCPRCPALGAPGPRCPWPSVPCPRCPALAALPSVPCPRYTVPCRSASPAPSVTSANLAPRQSAARPRAKGCSAAKRVAAIGRASTDRGRACGLKA
jgi:hypothetical protein